MGTVPGDAAINGTALLRRIAGNAFAGSLCFGGFGNGITAGVAAITAIVVNAGNGGGAGSRALLLLLFRCFRHQNLCCSTCQFSPPTNKNKKGKRPFDS